MENLFKSFLQERRYLRNLSEGTLVFYQETFTYFNQVGTFDNLSKDSIQKGIIALRERGVSTGGINTYLRGLNAFLRWLHAEHGYDNLSIKLLKGQKPILKSLTDTELRALISYKPKDKYEKRLHVLILTLLDTGLRINELITLKRESVDFDNLLLTVMGKGSKERIVPFSYELRKALYKHLNSHSFGYVFPTRSGGKLTYCNVLRDYTELTRKLGIKTYGSAFHQLRRTFATNFIRKGGSPFTLMRILGHSSYEQTALYVKLVTEDLQEESHRTSILNRLR